MANMISAPASALFIGLTLLVFPLMNLSWRRQHPIYQGNGHLLSDATGAASDEGGLTLEREHLDEGLGD